MTRLSTAVITITIIVIAATSYGVYRFFAFSSLLKEKIEIVVYLEPAADASRIKTDISRNREVKEIIFVSKDDALRMFRREMGGDSGIFEVMPVNPLPDSFIVRLKAKYAIPDGFEKICSRIKLLEGVSEVRYEKKILERAFPLLQLGERIVLICGIVMLGYTSLVILTILKLNRV